MTLLVLASELHVAEQGSKPFNLGGFRGSDITFWASQARVRRAKSELGSTVPRKMGLNWFMPALVKSRVGVVQRHHAAAGHRRVALGLEELYECRAHPVGCAAHPQHT